MTNAARRPTAREIVLAATIAATAAVIVLALGGSLAATLPGDAGRSAAGASRLLAGVVAIASGAAYLLTRSGKRQLGIALGAGATLMAGAWLALMGSRAPIATRQPLLASDRAPLEEREIDGERWAVHPTLAFRLPQPTVTLVPSREIVEETAARSTPEWRREHQLWAFESEDRSVTVVLDLSHAPSTEAELLQARVEAAVAPLRAQGLEVRLDAPEAGGGCRDARFDAALASGGHVDGRAWAFEDPRSHRAFHLVATIVAPIGARGRDYLDAVVVPCS